MAEVLVILFLLTGLSIIYADPLIDFLRRPKRWSCRAGQRRIFDCRADMVRIAVDGGEVDAFTVKIRGSGLDLVAAGDRVLISITEQMGDQRHEMPVLSEVQRWMRNDSPVFCYKAHTKGLCERHFTNPDWIGVATIGCQFLKFPRKGQKKLKFTVSIVSEGGQERLLADCIVEYWNEQAGYVDIRADRERTGKLTMWLAFAVGKVTGQAVESVVDVAGQWAKDKAGVVSCLRSMSFAGGRFGKLFQNNARLYAKAGRLDIETTCREILAVATVAQRYGAIVVCLRIAGQSPKLEKQHTDMLRRIAKLLEIPDERFLRMSQKILPVTEYQIEDADFVLGVTEAMTQDAVVEHLNGEYQKWNARVTCPDGAVRSQAAEMLKLVAQARNLCSEGVGAAV